MEAVNFSLSQLHSVHRKKLNFEKKKLLQTFSILSPNDIIRQPRLMSFYHFCENLNRISNRTIRSYLIFLFFPTPAQKFVEFLVLTDGLRMTICLVYSLDWLADGKVLIVYRDWMTKIFFLLKPNWWLIHQNLNRRKCLRNPWSLIDKLISILWKSLKLACCRLFSRFRFNCHRNDSIYAW